MALTKPTHPLKVLKCDGLMGTVTGLKTKAVNKRADELTL